MTLAVRSKTKSKITIPPKAHPFVRLAFGEMARQNVTYESLEWAAGVLVSTIKAWRRDNRPGLETIEAALGALGWELIPVPRYDRIPKNVQDGLEALRDLWTREEPLLHQFLAVCCNARTLPTKTPGGTRPQQAAEMLKRSIKRGVRVGLNQPIKSHGKAIDSVTVRPPRTPAWGAGDFKGGSPATTLADYVTLSPAQVANLSPEDAEKIFKLAEAIRSASAAAPILAEYADLVANVALQDLAA